MFDRFVGVVVSLCAGACFTVGLISWNPEWITAGGVLLLVGLNLTRVFKIKTLSPDTKRLR